MDAASAENSPKMGWPDIVGEILLAFFNWPLTGLAKSILNYEDVRQDRWLVFRLSLAGLATLVLSVAALGCALTSGEGRWWTPIEEYGWWVFAGLTCAFLLLTLVRAGVCVTEPPTGA
ncbi:MAG: hypothetical protein KA066_02680 [Candidatus Pacebacteria bacterium]|nr:hypothetical protein [Candidatus Paceibacterota bacterium]